MRYAIDFPNEAQNLILLAPTLSKRHEMPRIYNYVAKCKWVNKRISQQMRISNQEMFQLPEQLEQMSPLYKDLRVKTWLFHGKMDMIAPYGNALFLKRKLPKGLLTFRTYPWQNHFIPWTKFEDIKELLLSNSI